MEKSFLKEHCVRNNIINNIPTPINNSGTVLGYEADVKSANLFYPFGSVLRRGLDLNGDGDYIDLGEHPYSDGDYRFGFQSQEKDDEITGVEGSHVNYKYRMHDTRLGRFFATDPLAASYPWNSPYAFSENRLIDAVELEGLELVLTHGTFADRKDRPGYSFEKADYGSNSTWTPAQNFVQTAAKSIGWDENSTFEFGWTGKNKSISRRQAAITLVSYLTSEANLFKNLKHVTLMGHSHGGNVNKLVKNRLEQLGWKVDIINIATPQRKDYQTEKNGTGVYLNFYSENDFIQWFGTDDNYVFRDDDNVGSLGARKDPNAQKNEEVDISKNWFNNSAGHSYHTDSKAEKQMLKTIKEVFGKKK